MNIKNYLVSLSLLSFIASCDSGKDGSKAVSSPAKFVDSSTSSGGNKSSDAVVTKSDKLYDQLIESEKNARMAEDQKLQTQIDEINKKVTELGLKLDNEIAKLQAKDIELAQQVVQLEKDFGLN